MGNIRGQQRNLTEKEESVVRETRKKPDFTGSSVCLLGRHGVQNLHELTEFTRPRALNLGARHPQRSWPSRSCSVSGYQTLAKSWGLRGLHLHICKTRVEDSFRVKNAGICDVMVPWALVKTHNQDFLPWRVALIHFRSPSHYFRSPSYSRTPGLLPASSHTSGGTLLPTPWQPVDAPCIIRHHLV